MIKYGITFAIIKIVEIMKDIDGRGFRARRSSSFDLTPLSTIKGSKVFDIGSQLDLLEGLVNSDEQMAERFGAELERLRGLRKFREDRSLQDELDAIFEKIDDAVKDEEKSNPPFSVRKQIIMPLESRIRETKSTRQKSKLIEEELDDIVRAVQSRENITKANAISALSQLRVVKPENRNYSKYAQAFLSLKFIATRGNLPDSDIVSRWGEITRQAELTQELEKIQDIL